MNKSRQIALDKKTQKVKEMIKGFGAKKNTCPLNRTCSLDRGTCSKAIKGGYLTGCSSRLQKSLLKKEH